jgi:CRP-like cAMP-binding protein
MYFIGSGKVGVYLKGGNRVAVLKAGSFFGELAVFEQNSTRTASTICEEDTVVLSIGRGHINLLCKKHPELRAIMAKRLKKYKFDSGRGKRQRKKAARSSDLFLQF